MNIQKFKSFGWPSILFFLLTFFLCFNQPIRAAAITLEDHDGLASLVVEGIKNSFSIETEKQTLLNAHSQQTINYSGMLPSISLSAQQAQSNTQSQDSTSGAVASTMSTKPSLAFGATWTLWDNYKSIRNIQIGQRSIDQEKIRSQQLVQKYVLDLITAYLSYEGLRSNRQTLEKHLKISQETNEESQILVQVGAKTKIDAMDTEIQVANDELALADINRAIASAERNLRVLINSDRINSLPHIDILNSEPYFLKSAEEKISQIRKEWRDKIQEENYDLRIQQLELEKSSMALSQLKFNYFPTTQISFTQTLDGSTRFQEQPTNGERPWLNSYTLTLSMSWQMWDWMATPSNIRIASRNYQVASLNYRQQFLQSKADLETLFDQIDNLNKTISTARLVLLKAEKQTEYSQETYRLGRITLLQMQTSLNRLSSARNDLQARLIERALTIANLFYKTGVELTPPDVDFSWIR